MNPEEDYQAALRHIQEVQENESVELDLGGLQYLTRLPPELAGLTALQSLRLVNCRQLSDFCPLAELQSIQTLDICGCGQLNDLSPFLFVG
jgi:hypothetical protein